MKSKNSKWWWKSATSTYFVVISIILSLLAFKAKCFGSVGIYMDEHSMASDIPGYGYGFELSSKIPCHHAQFIHLQNVLLVILYKKAFLFCLLANCTFCGSTCLCCFSSNITDLAATFNQWETMECTSFLIDGKLGEDSRWIALFLSCSNKVACPLVLYKWIFLTHQQSFECLVFLEQCSN